MDTNLIGSRVYKIRRESTDWSQAALAEVAGLHVNTINNLEAGRLPNVSLVTLEQVALALGVDLSDLLDGVS